jgi:signal peptidase I
MIYFDKRRARKNAGEILRQAYHLRCYKEDLMKESDLQKLLDAEAALKQNIEAADIPTLERLIEALAECMDKVTPAGRRSSLIENFEILVVAIAVAMGFRSYFIQPFKIPTGSMEPTLNGIHAEADPNPGYMDKVPLKYFKWIAYGEWYKTIRIVEDGVYTGRYESAPDEASVYWYVGGRRYKLPRSARPDFYPGTILKKGDVLWAGREITGDHVFVDKISWNFAKPRRGQVTVFSTEGIRTLPAGTHYIKRLIALPGETIRIVPPNIEIDGQVIYSPEGIVRIEQQRSGYNAGYVIPHGSDELYIGSSNDFRKLDFHEYFVLGDNTTNSRDGRYWGTVPAQNTVGPAVLVYWPFSRFGSID